MAATNSDSELSFYNKTFLQEQTEQSLSLVDYIYTCGCIFLFLTGTFANLVIVIVVLCHQSLGTTMTLFLTNLTAGNFFVILLCLPFTVLEDLYQKWYGGEITCKLVKYLQNVSVVASVLLLLALSVERRLAILGKNSRITANSTIPTRRTHFICFLIWTIALVLSVPMPIILEVREDDGGCTYMEHVAAFGDVYDYFLFGIMICLPIVVVAVLHFHVAAILFKHSTSTVKGHSSHALANNSTVGAQQAQLARSSASRASSSTSSLRTLREAQCDGHISIDRFKVTQSPIDFHEQAISRSARRIVRVWKHTARILVLLAFLFVISYLPLCIVHFAYSLQANKALQYVNETNSTEAEIDWKPWYLFAHFIFYLYPAANPLIFYAISCQLRRVIRTYVKRCTSICVCHWFSLRRFGSGTIERLPPRLTPEAAHHREAVFAQARNNPLAYNHRILNNACDRVSNVPQPNSVFVAETRHSGYQFKKRSDNELNSQANQCQNDDKNNHINRINLCSRFDVDNKVVQTQTVFFRNYSG